MVRNFGSAGKTGVAGIVLVASLGEASAAGLGGGPVLLPPVSALHDAQASGGGEAGSGGDSDPGGDSDGAAAAAAAKSKATTTTASQQASAVVAELEGITDTCERVNATYRVDCIASELEFVAATLPRRGDYRAARQALNQASNRLNRLTRRNRDASQPLVRVKLPAGDPRDATRPLTAVRGDTVSSTNTEARLVLDATVTTLLRASERSADRSVHYQRIAEAVGSNKLLLRS